jgi:hypothetical protein
MKKLSIVVLAFLVSVSLKAQSEHNEHDGHNHGPVTQVSTDDVLKLKETEHDFSKIPQG